MIVSGRIPPQSQLKRRLGLEGPAPLEILVGSGGELKDAATEETEGATPLTVATYRPARAILKNPDAGPHSSAVGRLSNPRQEGNTLDSLG